ncbi:transposase, partial [Streptomyces sp. NPDC006393]
METALEVIVEHTDQSRPSRTLVIARTRARVIARFGEGVVAQPSRATAFRILADLERRHPFVPGSGKQQEFAGGGTGLD